MSFNFYSKKKTVLNLTLCFLLTFCFAPALSAGTNKTAYDFTFTNIDGKVLPLGEFKGKILLIVNTASRCGFTKQYADLQALWEQFRDQGLVVLGVPSNDFGNQEPGTESEIKLFCKVNFQIDFPMTQKTKVKGENAHPFYIWAARRIGTMGKPRWNFHKFLIGANGRLVNWFSTMTSPRSKKIIQAIKSRLPHS